MGKIGYVNKKLEVYICTTEMIPVFTSPGACSELYSSACLLSISSYSQMSKCNKLEHNTFPRLDYF